MNLLTKQEIEGILAGLDIDLSGVNSGAPLLNTMRDLARTALDAAAAKDAAYLERNKLVALLAAIFPSGIARTAIEGWSDDWHGCVYIDFPWGQASWHYHDSQAHLFEHLPPYAGSWDGHTTEAKYEAIVARAKELTPSAIDLRTRLAAAEARVGALQSWFRRRYSGGHDEGCAAKTHVNRSCSCGWDTLYAALASAAGGAK
jgi:hypothetical protein